MRSRYSAFALHKSDYLLASWHPKTRPGELRLDPRHRWTGLEIIETTDGGEKDALGTVTYKAHSTSRDGRSHTLLEHSRFERYRGAWVYVDGDVQD